MIACAIIGFFPFVRDTRVPVLGLFDLGMHELGHLLFLWAGETAHFLAGSVVQVLVPMGLSAYFWMFRRDLAATAFLGAWAGASLWDVSVYVADAPFERLQLIGGDHDWAFLLHKYDVMHLAVPLAASIRVAGGVAVIAAVGLAAAGPWLEDRLRKPASSSIPHVWGKAPAAERSGAGGRGVGVRAEPPSDLQSVADGADTPDDPWD